MENVILNEAIEVEKNTDVNLYDYYNKRRINMNKEADDILEEIKNGKTPSNIEIFTLICNNKEKIKQYAVMEELREKSIQGDLTKVELRCLVNKNFGIDTKEADGIYNLLLLTSKEKEVEKINENTENNSFITTLKSQINTENIVYEKTKSNNEKQIQEFYFSK